ncbi:MAG: hypothetical protein JXP73_06885 [Deltaproteobacteria bacterium]|jgi:hypothetical protein|nr:hypothetical protein [Deltaproteobacteria bacterium]
MTKKLAAIVYVFSLAAFGCGSDSGTPKKDAGKDAPVGTDTMVIPDVPIQPDAPIKPEVGADKPMTPDLVPAVDMTPKVDVEIRIDSVTTPVDGGEDATITPPIDGGAVDAEASEAGAAVDAGTPVDAESAG